MDLDGLGANWPIRVDPGAPCLALAPALAFAQHFDETDFDDDAVGSPGEWLLADKLGVRCTFASRPGIEGDEPVETVEEIRQVHRGAPNRQFVPVSLVGVTTLPTAGVQTLGGDCGSRSVCRNWAQVWPHTEGVNQRSARGVRSVLL